ncbi:uncharacterized protein LOC111102913 [Crassostrea virginica]
MKLLLLPVLLATCVRAGLGSQLQACGSALTDILSLVCRNQFHEPAKRSLIPKASEFRLGRGRRFAVGRGRRFAVGQKRGGVVEECCFSSCSYENLLLYCSQSVDPIDIFTAARDDSSTRRPFLSSPSTTTTTTTRATATITSSTSPQTTTTTHAKPEVGAGEADDKAAQAAWALSRRWFYVNRLGRFRGQVGRRIINM